MQKNIPIQRCKEKCYSALTRAISYNQYEIVRVLIDYCDMSTPELLNKMYADNIVPFHEAIFNREYEVARTLCLKSLMVTRSFNFWNDAGLYYIKGLIDDNQYHLIDGLIEKNYIKISDILGDDLFFRAYKV